MKRLAVLAVIAAMLLSGCSIWNSTYVRVTPSSGRTTGYSEGSAPAENYEQLREALGSIVSSGVESGVIYAVNMEPETLADYLARASDQLQTKDPLGAYAVEKIFCEVGTNGGKMAAAVKVSYRRSAMEVRKILRVADMAEVKEVIWESLEDFSPRVAMLIEEYQYLDSEALVRSFADSDPQIVIEVPEVSQEVYGSGSSRVMELSFSYRNSRDALRLMKEQVQPVFDSAALYVSGDASDSQKLAQLCAFLMERFDYSLETSLTPAYSLLHHGVGDSKAFATVYAAMCRQSGLECAVVTGTRMGYPWNWNIVRDGDAYYHVDLLRAREDPVFTELTDAEMAGYVWDYSAYPACGGRAENAPQEK